MTGNSLEVSISDIRLIKDFRDVFGFSDKKTEGTFNSVKGVICLLTILERRGLVQIPEQAGQLDTVKITWMPEERKCLFSIFASSDRQNTKQIG